VSEDTSSEETPTTGGKTLGDLVSALRETLKDPEDPNLHRADLWIDELQSAAGGGWDEAMKWPLDEGGVVALAQLLTDEIAYEVQAGPGELYEETLKCGHALLRLVHAKATEMGVNIPLDEVDVPLSPSESAVQSGLFEEVGGRIHLTDEGLAAAHELQEQIDAHKEE
jgi:hypothetical protein